MRSREEQIDVLAEQIWMAETSGRKARELACQHIDEAIQRGRELERAEMGRDTERLDWLEKQRFPELRAFDDGFLVATDQVCRSSGMNTARAAIDAAMNAGNGNG